MADSCTVLFYNEKATASGVVQQTQRDVICAFREVRVLQRDVLSSLGIVSC